MSKTDSLEIEMLNEYDFSNAKRGPVVPASKNKARITIRLDRDTLDWFRNRADQQGGGSYQAMINAALRAYIAQSDENWEGVLRRVIREELAAVAAD